MAPVADETVMAALSDRDWTSLEQSLDCNGYAILPALLTPSQCEQHVGLYPCNEGFRTRVVMARHGFGLGEYKYFAYPLPPLLEALRRTLYARLAPIANRWNDRFGAEARYPERLNEYLDRCHAAGQTRPTPLILEYGVGDYNCLHQDLYGEHVFPLQVAMLLSEPQRDFTGGEFIITETASTGQRANVVPLRQGDAVVFAVNERPVIGKGGKARKVRMRHGVSAVRSGRRYTLGLIFHDAR